jgi:predicted acyl esterase
LIPLYLPHLTEPDHVPGDTATYTFPVANSIHIIGQPVVNVYYSAVGTDMELIAKLWDFTPSGTQTLITRGLLRIDPMGDVATIRTFGNDYVIPAGDTLKLEISNVDSPYLRPDNLPSTTTIYYVDLNIPVK